LLHRRFLLDDVWFSAGRAAIARGKMKFETSDINEPMNDAVVRGSRGAEKNITRIIQPAGLTPGSFFGG
jgi:hypothetical protein